MTDKGAAMRKKEREISLDEISKETDKNIGGADELRADEMERLPLVLKAREGNLSREHARLARKLGTAHPRVAGLTSKIEIHRGLLREVAAETERARTEVPDPGEQTWVPQRTSG